MKDLINTLFLFHFTLGQRHWFREAKYRSLPTELKSRRCKYIQVQKRILCDYVNNNKKTSPTLMCKYVCTEFKGNNPVSCRLYMFSILKTGSICCS